MKIVTKHKTERDLVELGELELVRLKMYSSSTGETNISWKFREDMKDVGEKFSARLEKRFMRKERKRAIITR